jgi:4-hydroxy-tetrahydrodipicolinate synthase
MRTGIGSEYVRAPRLQLEGTERQNVLQIIDEAISNRPKPVFNLLYTYLR